MNMNNWIDHLHHPLVFAGFGLFLFALIIKPLFLNNKKLPGTAIERLLRRAMILLFLLAAMAIAGGIALNWKATPEAVPEKTGKSNPRQSIQQYEEELKKLKQQVVDLQSSEAMADEKQRHLLEAQLEGVQEHLSDVRTSWEEEKARRKAADAVLDKFKGQLTEVRIAAAKESLEKGDTEAAEQVFDELVDKEGESVALAAYQSGQLAEGRLDYTKAMQRYTKAVALEEDNPDYLLAAGRMACTLADYDRAQEWLTKMPNEMSVDHLFDLIDMATQLSYHIGNYRAMSILMIMNLGLKALQRKIDWKTGIENYFRLAISTFSSEVLPGINAVSHLDLSSPESSAELLAFMNHLNLFSPEMSLKMNVVIDHLDSGLEEVGYSPQAFLHDIKKRLGQDHPEVAHFCNNFAFLYLLQSDYKKATPLIQCALKIKEKTLGKNHPSMAITLNNLAMMHRLQEHYEEAESLYQRSLNIVSTSFRKDHPQVAAALNNLAELYKIQDRDEEANSLHQRAAAIQKAGDKETAALLQRIISIISHNSHLLNIDQAYYNDLKRKIAEP